MLNRGYNVAVVFGVKNVQDLPKTYKGFKVINGDESDLELLKKLQRARHQETLRRDVEQLNLAGVQPACHVLALNFLQGGIEKRRIHTELLQCHDLVLHERNQGRDDDPHSRAHHGRQLITERFTSTCRKNDKRIPSIQHTLHRLFLQRQKRVITPMFL